MRRAVIVLAFAGVLALTSCTSTLVGGAPRGRPQCVPETVAVSRVVAKPGARLQLSAQAASCAVTFTEDGLLTLVMRRSGSADDDELPLGEVRAAPSGAFRLTARVPEETAAGDWVIAVSDGLAAVTCNDTGGGLASCAAPVAYLHTAPRTEDWTRGSAERRAAAVAERIERDLEDVPGFLGAEVLPGGVQVSLAPPFRDRTDRIITAAGGAQPRSDGAVADGRVPVVRFNGRFNRVELTALKGRVERARPALLRRGIEIEVVELDRMTATVTVRVPSLTDASARELSRRFGTALVPLPAGTSTTTSPAPAASGSSIRTTGTRRSRSGFLRCSCATGGRWTCSVSRLEAPRESVDCGRDEEAACGPDRAEEHPFRCPGSRSPCSASVFPC